MIFFDVDFARSFLIHKNTTYLITSAINAKRLTNRYSAAVHAFTAKVFARTFTWYNSIAAFHAHLIVRAQAAFLRQFTFGAIAFLDTNATEHRTLTARFIDRNTLIIVDNCK